MPRDSLDGDGRLASVTRNSLAEAAYGYDGRCQVELAESMLCR
ncbi:MAG TPA: hypothetical protein PKA33_21700 [Amaricoccus sp.]|nr:hypothetical protein [Amaricoccus sp.]HMR54938.1 hypothetical protein [Amaricoccus sp.]HMU01942.1 hypothetical protein [Amaricoccus sp.]